MITRKFSLRIFEEGNNKSKKLKTMQEIVSLPTEIMQKFEEINSQFPSTGTQIVTAVKNFESNLEESNFTKRQSRLQEFATGKISFYHKQTIGFQGSWNG